MKILLLQLKRIGDLILTTPVIAALREKFPDAKITFVLARESAALLPAIPGIDDALVIRRNVRDLSVFARVARERFDCAIDFTQNDRSALLSLLSRAQTRVVSARLKTHSSARTRIYNRFAEVSLKNMHTLDYNLGLLAPLGIAGISPFLNLEAPADAQEKARALLRLHKAGDPFVIFHPGSARVEKFWEPQRWAQIIEHTQSQRGFNAVITGGNWPFEQDHIRAIKSSLPNDVVDLSGRTDLLTLMAVIAQARLLVTVDSAAMHLAAAQGVAQVALFGPTNPFHWRPRQSPALILHGESPRPVTEFLPEQPRRPMNHISTEAVFNAMESLLSAPAAQRS